MKTGQVKTDRQIDRTGQVKTDRTGENRQDRPTGQVKTDRQTDRQDSEDRRTNR